MKTKWMSEIWSNYLELLPEALPLALLGGGLSLVLGLLFYVLRNRAALLAWLKPVSALLAAGYGLTLVWEKRSLFDDAFISLRYASNFVRGHGLVWNIGERVEGYTNFLWTLLMALGLLVSPLSPEHTVLLMCVSSYLLAAGLIYALGQALVEDHWVPPIAAILYLLHGSAIEFATSGMETQFGVATMLLGLFCLVRAASGKPRAWLTGGLVLIAATMTRPDYGLFWAAGGLVSLGYSWREGRRGLDLLRIPALYGASFAVYLLYGAWKLSYYGAILPNTYWAKSGDLTYYSQGLIYLLTFVLGSHAWIPIVLGAIGGVGVSRSGCSMKQGVFWLFTAISVPLYGFYVVRVGGDFMYGRFFLPAVPLLLLASQQLVSRAVSGQRVWLAIGLLFVLGLGWSPLRIVGPDFNRWFVSNEWEVYQVEAVWPEVELEHGNALAGKRFAEVFDGDVKPRLATSGIGMVGYYSDLYVLDMRGLTEPTIARLPVEERGMPGHEKWPTREYLVEQDIDFVRWRAANPKRWRRYTAVSLAEPHSPKHWHLLSYPEPDLLSAMSDDTNFGHGDLSVFDRARESSISEEDHQFLVEFLRNRYPR
jgi:arabinofuranosyltransferase